MKASTRSDSKFANVQPIDRTQSRKKQYEAAKNAVEAFDLFLQEEKALPTVLHEHPTKGDVPSNHAVSGNVPWWMAFVQRGLAREDADIQAMFEVWREVLEKDPRPSVKDSVAILCELSKGDGFKRLEELSNVKALRTAIGTLRLALNSALPPFHVAHTTTHCRMKRDTVDSDNLPDLMDLLEDERVRPGTLAPRLAEDLDLRNVTLEELVALVKAAARAGASLQGCGITKETAVRLARRLEQHCEEHPADADALKTSVGQLCVVKRARNVQLTTKGSVKPIPTANLETISVGFKECRTSKPVPPGEGLVITTRGLKTCTAIAVVTKFSDGSRVVTLAHMPNADMHESVAIAVKNHHFPDRKILDHEIFVVTPGVEIPSLDHALGIYMNDVRLRFKMGRFTAPAIGEPASTDTVGPTWFHHAKTTLIPYPRAQNARGKEGAEFTLVVPEDASSPVEFFLDLN